MPKPAKITKARRRFRRTLRITAVWAVLSLALVLHDQTTLRNAGIAQEGYLHAFRMLLNAVVAGLLAGGAYVFLLHDRLRRLPFLAGYGLVLLLIAAGIVTVHVLPTSGSFAAHTVQMAGQFTLWALLMGGTMLMLRLDDQFGNGTIGYFMDKYRRPRQELRIFMFLDMRSSSVVAESIGDTLYFKLLGELYADITDPVVYTEGEIYQYVGDEISVSWRLDRGIRNIRCIRCFFAIRDKLRNRAEHYRNTYGTVPVFKAGLHFGRVTTGEIGLVKRQTLFSGDVVNTTAHIQSRCNDLGVDNLVSKELLDVLPLRNSPYQVKPVGSIPLKGKRHAVELFTLSPKEEAQ